MSDLTPPNERQAPGLRLHKRTMRVLSAHGNLGMLLIDFQRERELTDVEMVSILLEATQSIHKYALRMERHGTTDKKADEA